MRRGKKLPPIDEFSVALKALYEGLAIIDVKKAILLDKISGNCHKNSLKKMMRRLKI